MKQKEQLSGFLIRRLVAVLAFLAMSQALISLFFTNVFYPFAVTHFHIDILEIVHATSSSPITILKSLLGVVGTAFLNVMPEYLRGSLRAVIERYVMPNWTGYLAGISAQNQWKTTLLFASILVFGLIVYVLPYVCAILVYSKWVLQKVEELRQQDALEREKSEQQRNLLLSDVAHDLKTPITTIAGYATALKDHIIQDAAKEEEYLTIISAKSMQVSQLINLLFQYVTLDSEGFTLNCKKVNLPELVTETVAVNYSDLEAAGVELEMKVPEIPIMVSVDEIQMTRAITNLIQNAIRHNPKNTRLTVSVQNLLDRVTIDVADSGVVIEESIAEHLFDPFVMGDDSRTQKGGSGLGLSISAKVIELHGGSISLKQPHKIDSEIYTKAFHIEMPIGNEILMGSYDKN